MTDRLSIRPPREEQAWQEIGHTEFKPGVRRFLFVFFLGFIAAVPLLQALLPPPGNPKAVPAPHSKAWSTGRILAVSAPPQEGGVYKDFVMTSRVHAPEGPIEVRFLAMRDRTVLPSAALKAGDTIRFDPQAWDEVKDQMGSLKTSALPDADSEALLPQFWARALETDHPAPEASGLGFLSTWHGTLQELGHAWTNSGGGLLTSFLSANKSLGRRIHLYEDALDDNAWLTLLLRSPVQALMVRLGVGNEKAYVGHDGWLFYEPGVKSLSGPGFLDPAQLRKRARAGGGFSAAIQPDPRPAILQFHADLAARGIELILLPTPVKPSIHPEKLAPALSTLTQPLRNRSFDAWKGEMQAAGIRVLDPGAILKQGAATQPQFLKTDTHWTPDAMRGIARWVRDQPGLDPVPVTLRATRVRVENIGDIGAMLELPPSQTVLSPETHDIQSITFSDGSAFRFDPKAELLLLGDSFSNIYSIEAMGWGRDAGFGEQLSVFLGAPIDRISRNDAAAFATREMLLRELQENPARLDGKKVVLWQFAERELAVGDWKVLPLPAVVEAIPAAPSPKGLLMSDIGDEDPLAVLGSFAADSFREQPAFAGADDWLFLTAELTHLGTGRFWGEMANPTRASKDPDPFAALVDLHQKLDELGIELILMPAPPRAAIYPDKLLGGLPLDEHGIPKRIDTHHQAFYAELREAGLTVIDLTDALLAARRNDASLGPVCLPQDSHWSPRGIAIAVQGIAAALDGKPWLESAPAIESHMLPEQTLQVKGDLADRVPGLDAARMALRIQQASLTPETFSRIPKVPDSPILLLADSHGLVFHLGGDMLCEGAGLADQLAHELGIGIDLMGMRGSGSSVRRELARRFLTKPADAAQKKVVIYTFAARAFTESENWTLVPLKR